ncbi:MAG: FtsX-like permease family protein, partial [Pyrinomonadaceae bacterium]
IGQRLHLGGDEKETQEIIGVVADVKNDDLEEIIDPTAYLPHSQNANRTMSLVIRSTQDPTRLVSAVRSEVRALDPALPVSNVKTLSQMIHERISPKRLMTYILAVFALSALVLASVGIYGVMSYTVTQRTHEIGIRVAIGAQSRDVFRMVIGQGMMLAMIGVAFGLVGAFGLTRLMTTMLFGVEPTDPATFVSIAVLL